MLIRSLLMVALVVCFAAPGCIFSPPKDNDPPPPPPPINTCPESADVLMQVFRTVYTARNIDAYREILSRDFIFVTEDRTETYGYDEEINRTYKMFTGLAGTDGLSISNITIDRLDPQGVWQSTDPNDENFGGHPNSLYRDYLVDFNFYVAGQNLRFRVQGPVRFFVKTETVDDESCFRYLGMEDYTFGAS